MPQEQEKVKEETEISFEDALARLEELAGELETGGLTLQKMIEKADEAAKLNALCQKQLNELDEKVKILEKDTPNGQVWKDFEDQEEQQ